MRAFPLTAVGLLLLWLAPTGTWAQQLQCRPCILGFGKVTVGSSKSYSIHLKNTGTTSLRILYEAKSGNAFTATKLTLPETLLPGARVQLNVTFTPRMTGRTTGTITFKSTALPHRIYLSLAGTGVSGPQLTVSPSTLNFGNVTVGQSTTLAATLSASNGDVTITSDQLTSSEFSLVGLNLPKTIPSGQNIQATVQFTPNQSGTATGRVGYFSNAVVSPAVEQLTGNGVAPGSHSTDLTWQESDPAVVGFNIYRGSTHGGPYYQINTALDSSTNYTDSTVAAGTTYYYVTTAVNGAGQESSYSNEAKAVIPSP